MDRSRSATGTFKWNQVRKFSTTSMLPWQKRQVTDSFVSVFSLSRSSRGCKCSCGNWRVTFRAWLLVQLLQPLLLVEVRALYYSQFSAQSELNDFFLPAVADKNVHDPSFLRRHLNQSCGMYCVIKWHHYILWFVSWQVTPKWQDLSTGNLNN